MKIIKHISRFDFRQNGYLIYDRNKAVIIDPGDAPNIFINKIERYGLTLSAVLATHGHIDHVYGAKILCEHYSVPFVMNTKDQDWLDAIEPMSKQFNIEYIGTPQIDMDISQKNEIILGKMKFHILHTPGHTPGSVCYFINGILFSGDTLFYHSVGRTDLPRSDADLLNRSVKETLFVLPDETVVYPGHMNSTTILEEKKSNPFII